MPAAHLLLLLLVPLAFGVFLLLRQRPLHAGTQALVAIATAGITWAIVFTWSMLKPAYPTATEAFNSVEYFEREVPADWLWSALFITHGWIVGFALFGACWLLARLYRQR